MYDNQDFYCHREDYNSLLISGNDVFNRLYKDSEQHLKRREIIQQQRLQEIDEKSR